MLSVHIRYCAYRDDPGVSTGTTEFAESGWLPYRERVAGWLLWVMSVGWLPSKADTCKGLGNSGMSSFTARLWSESRVRREWVTDRHVVLGGSKNLGRELLYYLLCLPISQPILLGIISWQLWAGFNFPFCPQYKHSPTEILWHLSSGDGHA